MHFGKDECAHCGLKPAQYTPEGKPAYVGRELPIVTKYMPDGTAVYGTTTTPTGPYFCTRYCFELATRRFFDKKAADRYKDASLGDLSAHEKEMLRKAERGTGVEYGERVVYSDASEVREMLLKKQSRLKEEHKRKVEEVEAAEWKEAYRKYASAWHRAELEESGKPDPATLKRRAELDRKIAYELNEHSKYLRRQELTAPRPIPDEPYRYEHTHILAPSGFGKSTLIQEILLADLKKDDPPGYVIIDPKGMLVDRISRLAVFDPYHGRLRDRLIIIDPSHEPPPALNMFSGINNSHLSPTQQRRVTNHLTEMFAYIFSSANAKLTQRQSVPFAFLIRLVFFIGGDINTLMDLLDDQPKTSKFTAEIAAFSETDAVVRRFFERDFYTTAFNETKGQIKARVYEILTNPDLMAMFAAKTNKIDFSECLRTRKIVLVNTSLAQLGSKGSQLLGRYVIAMVLSAAFGRDAIPKSEWPPCYLIIDEFQDYADEEKTPELLRLAREYNLGVTLAHQTMHSDELKEAMRTAISTNTSIKYCSSPEGQDVSYMVRDLRCEPEFLAGRTKTATHAQFACFVRGMGLSHPFRVECALGNIEAEPKMPEGNYRRLLWQNANALGETPVEWTGPEAAPPATPPGPSRVEDAGLAQPSDSAGPWGPRGSSTPPPRPENSATKDGLSDPPPDAFGSAPSGQRFKRTGVPKPPDVIYVAPEKTVPPPAGKQSAPPPGPPREPPPRTRPPSPAAPAQAVTPEKEDDEVRTSWGRGKVG